MKILRIVFGIINILACVSLVVVHSYTDWNEANAFTWGMPLLVAAVLALISGIIILKEKNWGCAVSGLAIAGVAWIYYLIILWIGSWSMA
jgi:hypothetical protein